MDTRDSIIREVTHEYLASVDKSNLPEPKEVAASILLNGQIRTFDLGL